MILALAGNPNCGKTTLFNALTGANARTGNFPGVTVTRSESVCRARPEITLVDLPGVYALRPYSDEERVTRSYLLGGAADAVISIADATCPARSLYLTLQLLELGVPVVLALNVMDALRAGGGSVDTAGLARALGIPVIQTQASKGIGKQELYSAITARHGRSGSAEIVDYGELETDIREITRLLPRQGVKGYPSRWFAIKLLEQDSLAEGLLASVDTEDGRIAALIRQCRESWATRHGEDMVRSIAHARFAQARDIAARCSERLEFVTSVTEKVDAVLCHRFWGPLILLGILFVFYQASVTLGNYLAAQVWPVWGKLEVWAAAVLPQQGFLEDPVLTALGLWIVKSITAVLNYLPIFVIMFALVAILEDSGYMARIAFILDRIFHRFGLHGQSTLPLILGGVYVGGCAIPGVIATRAIPDERPPSSSCP